MERCTAHVFSLPCQLDDCGASLDKNQGPTRAGARLGWTHEAHLDSLRGASLAIPVPLVAFVGFRLECVMVDVLQPVDQGVASHFIANEFWLFAVVRKSFGEGTHDTSMKLLFAHMQNCYKSHKVSSKWQASGRQGEDEQWLA